MKKILFSFIAMGTFSIAPAQQTCISPAAYFPINNDPRDMIKNDFNGDGFIDVATSNPNNNNVCVLRGNGTGGFAPVDSFAVNSFYPQGLTSADFNGDGKPDLATANNSGNNISVLLNTGVGSFSTAVTYTMNGSSPAAITSGDFNSDGFTDLATANNGSSNISVYLGNGTGGFSFSANYAAGNSPWYIVNADFNGDAKSDLAVLNHLGNNVSIFLCNGTGGFGAATNFAVGTDPRRICAADLNNDGKMDLATANYGSGDISVLIGSGTGSFNGAVSYATGGGPHSITTGDMNTDGQLDIAVADVTLSYIHVLQGTGTGTFGTPIPFYIYGSGPPSPYGIVAADFDMDAHTDLATANQNLNNVAVYLNNPSFVLSVAGQSIICNGNSTTLTASGATTYTWSANAGSATGYTVMLSPAVNTTYTVMATSGLCQASDTFHVIVNPLPSIFTSPNDVTCYGLCNGSTSASGSCISYTWSTGANTAGINNLCPGNYTVTGTDANGCIDSVWSPINQPAGPLVAAVTNIVNATCNGVANGGADDATTGGTPGYTYQWSCGSTTSTISGYGAGPYYLIATDAQACVDTVFFTLVNINPTPTLTISGPSTLCQGQSGQLTYTTNGLAPYTANWYDVVNAASYCSLDTSFLNQTTPGPDAVILTVTDNMGCVSKDTLSVLIGYGDSLSGIVKEPNTSVVTSGNVYLFQQKLSNAGLLDTIAVVPLGSLGDYTFANIIYGDYFVKVIADTSAGAYPTSIATYYSNKLYPFQWDSALAINHYTCNASNISGYNVTILETPALIGPGVIGGLITEGVGYGSRLSHGNGICTPGAPLKGVDVKLGKNPGGSPAARTVTDNTGHYTFTNVPINQAYRIYVDIPNYGMDSLYTVTLTSTDTVEVQNNYFVDSSMVRIDTTGGVGIITVSAGGVDISVFPNPVSDKIYVALKGNDKTEIMLVNALGGEVKRTLLQNEFTQIDVRDLAEGIYFVHVKTIHGILTTKIVVQR